MRKLKGKLKDISGGTSIELTTVLICAISIIVLLNIFLFSNDNTSSESAEWQVEGDSLLDEKEDIRVVLLQDIRELSSDLEMGEWDEEKMEKVPELNERFTSYNGGTLKEEFVSDMKAVTENPYDEETKSRLQERLDNLEDYLMTTVFVEEEEEEPIQTLGTFN